MALGTITKPHGSRSDYLEGNRKVRVRDVQLSSGANYTTGGETVTARSVGLSKIEEAQVLGVALTSSGTTSRSVGVIYGNGVTTTKLLVHTTASAEAANNSDQSTFTARIRFSGI
jgi:hypothetical protein